MPPYLPVPPKGYGGIEVVAAALLPELEAAGASISLATTTGSTVEVSHMLPLAEPIYPILSQDYNTVTSRVEAYVASVMELVQSNTYDVIHDFSGLPTLLNSLTGPLAYDRHYPPVLHTMHGPVEMYLEVYETLIAQHPRGLTLTGISQAQMSVAPSSVQDRTTIIYNGLRPEDYPVGRGGPRLLVMGRITRDKGQDRLVKYCAKEGLELDVAGTVAEMTNPRRIVDELAQGSASDMAGRADFELFRRIRRHIDGEQIIFHGNVSGRLKHKLLGGSRALVMPNRWAEPFGMVVIEAMASGTPVVAMNSGAMPELIEHGVTGYLADTFEQLCDYLRPEAIDQLDREACPQHVAERFSTSLLAQQWLSLYREVKHSE
jgi:glycosyltransferase involved in cell wall biosynthesis